MSEQNNAASTPAATWRVNGEDDPHGDYYDRERAALTLGNLTDDELANGAFMNYDHRPSLEDLLAGKAFMPIVWMTAVKDRIRWLSRVLVKAQAASAALAQQPQGEAPQKLFGFDVVVDGSLPPNTIELRNAAPSASPAADQAADRQWRAGFLAGWNAGVEGDESKLRAAQNRVGTLAEYQASASPAVLKGMSGERNKFQCAARGCDGCTVCTSPAHHDRQGVALSDEAVEDFLMPLLRQYLGGNLLHQATYSDGRSERPTTAMRNLARAILSRASSSRAEVEREWKEGVDAIMGQAQVFASAWSLVGGRFDDGSALETAEDEKGCLRMMVEKALLAAAEAPNDQRASKEVK